MRCTGSFTAPVEAHNVLALRITPVKEDAEQHERWRPWHEGGGSTSQPQSASQQLPNDRLSVRVKQQPYLQMQVHSMLRRFGLCS